MHLFAYGTLMLPEIWERVTGRPYRAQRATVCGFTVSRVRGGAYPVMLRSADDDPVSGMVHRDLDDASLALLDEYESDLYDRLTVSAALDTGETLECQAYVLPAERAHASSGQPWDADAFRRDHLAAYLSQLP